MARRDNDILQEGGNPTGWSTEEYGLQAVRLCRDDATCQLEHLVHACVTWRSKSYFFVSGIDGHGQARLAGVFRIYQRGELKPALPIDYPPPILESFPEDCHGPLESQRSTREVSDILLTALEPGLALGRREIVGQGLLSTSEYTRAVKTLSRTGRIRRSADTVGKSTADAQYVRKRSGPPAADATSCPPSSTHAPISFEGLLDAWQIRLPSAPIGERSVLRQRITQEGPSVRALPSTRR